MTQPPIDNATYVQIKDQYSTEYYFTDRIELRFGPLQGSIRWYSDGVIYICLNTDTR